jgi:hypothetical protein
MVPLEEEKGLKRESFLKRGFGRFQSKGMISLKDKQSTCPAIW